MKEKFILSFAAALLGLLVAGGGFYIYQMTKSPDGGSGNTNEQTKINVTPSPKSANFLIVENPADESISEKRLITISGKTVPNATIIVSTETADQVVKPAPNGDYSLTHTISEDVNVLQVTAIFPNGEEQTVKRTVTYTTDEF